MPGSEFAMNKQHTRTELGRIRRFRRFRWMRKYLPRVYYSNPKTGVSIIEFIQDSPGQRMQGMCDMASDLIYRLTGTKMTDISDNNVRVDPKREVVKLIDLAY
jgi:hypothetical protein